MSSTRRDFLRAGVGASMAMFAGPSVPLFLPGPVVAASRPRERDTVLVVIQLTGGNDGLNTVVPYADDEYARRRPTLRLPPEEVHRIDGRLAFHPRMEAFLRLYEQGYLSVVQGVGCAKPDSSHERAMRIWHTADPQRPERQTGWLGRVVDHAWSPGDADVRAVFVGSIACPFAMNAETAIVPSVRSIQDLTMHSTRALGTDEPMAEGPVATGGGHRIAAIRAAREANGAGQQQADRGCCPDGQGVR